MPAVIANFNSGVTIPSSDVYHRCGMPQVTSSSNPKVTQAGYNNLFRPIANDLSQGSAPADYALKTLGAKKAAIVHDKQAFGRGVAEVFQDTFKKGGGTVTSFSGVAQTDVDFSAFPTTIKSENPDVIYFGCIMPAVGLFVKRVREFGITAKVFGADSAFTPDFTRAPGRRMPKAPSCRSRRLPTTRRHSSRSSPSPTRPLSRRIPVPIRPTATWRLRSSSTA
jgi:branched-chain amino acid transport system substrate-binding protein